MYYHQIINCGFVDMMILTYEEFSCRNRLGGVGGKVLARCANIPDSSSGHFTLLETFIQLCLPAKKTR